MMKYTIEFSEAGTSSVDDPLPLLTVAVDMDEPAGGTPFSAMITYRDHRPMIFLSAKQAAAVGRWLVATAAEMERGA